MGPAAEEGQENSAPLHLPNSQAEEEERSAGEDSDVQESPRTARSRNWLNDENSEEERDLRWLALMQSAARRI